VSLSGDNALIGALYATGKVVASGAAYYYKELNNAQGGTNPSVSDVPYLTQTVKLLASDGEENDEFGYSVSLSGNNALIGASLGNGKVAHSGAAYYYSDLNDASKYLSGQNVFDDHYLTQTVKLMASDGNTNEVFGYSVSLLGTRFVIGAAYANVNAVACVGKSYAGDIRAFTTLDDAGVTLSLAGLSFISQTDWIIGANTNNTKVTLTRFWSINEAYEAGAWFSDTAKLEGTNTAVYIGKNNGASSNTLVVEGELTANKIYIGAAAGANNNRLIISANTLKIGAGGGKITAKNIQIGSVFSQGNRLILEMGGDELKLTFPTQLESAEGTTILLHRGNYLVIWGTKPDDTPGNPSGNSPLTPEEVTQVLAAANVHLKAGWIPQGEDITPAHAAEYINTSLDEELLGYTVLHANADASVTNAGGTPEPSTYALFGSVLLAGLMLIHRRRKRANPPQK
jgi:hypothetical protein